MLVNSWKSIPSESTYDANGKVNVRIGQGLKDDGHNQITVNIGDVMSFDEEGRLISSLSSNALNALKIDDREGHSFFYNPSTESPETVPKNVTYLHLGPGLIIVPDEPAPTPDPTPGEDEYVGPDVVEG